MNPCTNYGVSMNNARVINKVEQTCNNSTNIHHNSQKWPLHMNMSKNSNMNMMNMINKPHPKQTANTPITETRYKCDKCPKTFKRKANLSSHMKVHTDYAYLCEYCGKKFARSGNLVQHIRIHTNEKPFQCKYCSKKYVSINICWTYQY